jgi:hypothetical protein
MQVPFHDLPATPRMLILAPADDSISLSSSAGEEATKYSRDESRRDSVTKPRVARSSQPWAAVHSPFGIAEPPVVPLFRAALVWHEISERRKRRVRFAR